MALPSECQNTLHSMHCRNIWASKAGFVPKGVIADAFQNVRNNDNCSHSQNDMRHTELSRSGIARDIESDSWKFERAVVQSPNGLRSEADLRRSSEPIENMISSTQTSSKRAEVTMSR